MAQQPNSPEQPKPSHEQVLPPLESDNELGPSESQPETGREGQAEKQVEKDKPDDSKIVPTASDVVQAPPASTKDDKQASANPASNDTPDIANDVDVIEKAWVDKAKQIIKETKDDPNAQEEAFEKLQIEYHKKRYGRDIKATR